MGDGFLAFAGLTKLIMVHITDLRLAVCICSFLFHAHRSFWELVHVDDHSRLCMLLGQLVLTRSGMARLRCRICTSFADYYLPMDMTLKYGSLGVACSLWGPP